MGRGGKGRGGKGGGYDWRWHIRASDDPKLRNAIWKNIQDFISSGEEEFYLENLDTPARNTYKQMCKDLGVGFSRTRIRGTFKLVQVKNQGKVSAFLLLGRKAFENVKDLNSGSDRNHPIKENWCNLRWLLQLVKRGDEQLWMHLVSMGINNCSEKKLWNHEDELRDFFEISKDWVWLKPKPICLAKNDKVVLDEHVIEHCKPVHYDNISKLNELLKVTEKALDRMGVHHRESNNSANKKDKNNTSSSSSNYNSLEDDKKLRNFQQLFKEDVKDIFEFGQSSFFGGRKNDIKSVEEENIDNSDHLIKSESDRKRQRLEDGRGSGSDEFSFGESAPLPPLIPDPVNYYVPEDPRKFNNRKAHNSYTNSQAGGASSSSFLPNDVYKVRQRLPAFKRAGEFINKVLSNDVVVLCGATGCGKTTQLPQILMDYMNSNTNENSNLRKYKIMCTQPRRISATSVAERVAFERGEEIGGKVGYQVRFDRKANYNKNISSLSEEDGLGCNCDGETELLYCTVGILLRFLVGNPTLEGIDCVILDEVHERGLHTDFALLILRDLIIKRNDPLNARKFKPLKIILMSATIDASLFLKYFNSKAKNLPINLKVDLMDIPGKTNYKIDEYFAEDIFSKIFCFDPKFQVKGPGNRGGKYKDAIKVKQASMRNVDIATGQIGQYICQHFPEIGHRQFPKESDNRAQLAFVQENIDFLIHRKLQFDVDLVVKTVELIEKMEMTEYDSKYVQSKNNDYQDYGSILIFVPGWSEITDTIKALEKMRNKVAEFDLLPLHSMVPPNEQKKIFKEPYPGYRKIIVSTNLAETSITVEDIVYVIDTGLTRGTTYTPETNIASLETLQIARSNMQQRRGRAGRCKPGVLFKLYSKIDFDQFEDHEEPEMVRTPVEELCLQVKSLKLPGKIEGTLQKAISPPKSLAVENAIEILVGLGALVVNDETVLASAAGHNILSQILDSNEKIEPETLTPLGWKLSLMPIHPCLGKMLLFGSWLESAFNSKINENPNIKQTQVDLQRHLLSLCATLSFKSPFTLPLGKEKEADNAKKAFGFNCAESDHLLFAKVIDEYEGYGNYMKDIYNFCDRNFLSSKTLEMTAKTKKDLTRYLIDLKLEQSNEFAFKPKSRSAEKKSSNKHYSKKHEWNGYCLFLNYRQRAQLIKSNSRAMPHPGSLNGSLVQPKTKEERWAAKQREKWSTDYVLVSYFERLKTAEVYLRDTSVIQDCLPMLLFLPNLDIRSENKISALSGLEAQKRKKNKLNTKKNRNNADYDSESEDEERPVLFEFFQIGEKKGDDNENDDSDSEDEENLTLEEKQQKKDEEITKKIKKDKSAKTVMPFLLSVKDDLTAEIFLKLRLKINLLLEHSIGKPKMLQETKTAIFTLCSILIESYENQPGKSGRDAIEEEEDWDDDDEDENMEGVWNEKDSDAEMPAANSSTNNYRGRNRDENYGSKNYGRRNNSQRNDNSSNSWKNNKSNDWKDDNDWKDSDWKDNNWSGGSKGNYYKNKYGGGCWKSKKDW